MGEAKRKREELRQRFLQIVEGWSAAPTEWETRMVAEVKELPRMTVRRYPPHVLAYMNMKQGECHANCQFMQNEDPDGICQRVVGWTYTDGQFVLHSVVKRNDEYFCVTPVPPGFPQEIIFVPDPAITVEEKDGRYIFSRGGEEIRYGLRPNPAATLEFCNTLRERLNSGMNPYEAMDLAPPEL